LNIGLVQIQPVWENKDRSKIKISRLLDGRSPKVDLLIFPELTLTGFTMRSKRFAEKINGPTTKFFLSLADKYSCHIIAGFIEVDKDMYFNTLVHLRPGENLISKYRKIHPFSFSGENRHYRQGDIPIMTGINGYSIGLSICYDLRFPELFRYYAKAGVDININIANWPVDRIEHWYTLLKARAIENQCYMVGVNRVGSDKSIDYPGWSSVFHPFGQELCCLKEYEDVKIQNIESKEVKNTRDKYPFLKDIRLV
jgi:predicted amidohydrolase